MKNLDKYLSLLDGEVNGLLLTSRYSRHYGAEFDIAEGVAVVSKAGCRYFTDSRYIESAENGIKGFEVLMVDRAHSYSQRINDAIADFGISVLGFEENYLTVAEFRGFEAKLQAKLTAAGVKIHMTERMRNNGGLPKPQRDPHAPYMEIRRDSLSTKDTH